MQLFCGQRVDSAPLSGWLGGKLHTSRSEDAARFIEPAECAKEAFRITKFAFYASAYVFAILSKFFGLNL